MAILLTTTYQQIGTISLDYGEIRFYARYYEQSQANNYTKFQLKTTYYTYQNYVSVSSATSWLDGTRKDYGYTTFYKGETTIMEENRTQYHNDDGSSPTRNVGASWYGSFGGSGETYVDVVFPKIDRYPMITSAPNFSDEDNPTITYTTNVGFTDSITEICMKLVETGDPIIDYREVNVSNGSYTFEFTNEERNVLRNSTPNSNTVTIYILLRTMVNGIKYFSTVTRTMTIVNGNPTFTHSELETDSNVISVLGTSSADTIIQNASKMKVTIVPTALKGSTIASVRVASGVNYAQTKTTSPYEFIIPVTVRSFTAFVTDSRGNTKSTAVAKTLIEYNPVSLITFEFKRENPTSSNVILNLEANYYQKTFNNTANVPTVKWKLDDGTLTTIPSSNYSIDTTNNKLKITNYEITNVLDYRNKGTFTIVVQDLLTSATDKQEVLKGIPTFDYGEHDLQVNGELYVADINRANAYKVYDRFNYSTTEKVVGKWIDNKPIYRKVYKLTSLPGVDVSTAYNISELNIDRCVSLRGWTYSYEFGYIDLIFVNDGVNYVHLEGNNRIWYKYHWNASEIYFVLEYTKTTD